VSDCHKKSYPSLALALLALQRIKERSLDRGRKQPTGAYLCPQCRGQWHLTSKSPTQKPPWRKRRRRRSCIDGL